MEALAHNFIKAFGWSILDSFWQCGIVYGILLIALVGLPRLPARTRHNLSYLSLCVMFTWFCITFAQKFSFPSQPTVTEVIADSAFPSYVSLPDSLSLSSRTEAYFPLVIAAYLLGIMLQVLVILKGFLFVRALRRNQLEEVPVQWKETFHRIRASLNVSAKTVFKISRLAKVPLVTGYLKPIVLFPASLCSHLDMEQVEAILIHELSHIRRNDYILNLIKTSIETLLFFNPFVWMAGRFIHIEREHACDDMVLKFTGKPVSYAHALLALELFTRKDAPVYAMAASGKSQYLFQRIKRITNMKTNYLNLKQQMAALTLALACIVSLAWIRPAENKKARIEEAKLLKDIPFKPGNVPTKIEVFADTVPQAAVKKNKIKIVVTDNAGNKKEYNSVRELPDSLKSDFDVFGNQKFLFRNGDSVYFKQFNSGEWKKKQDDMVKEFSNPQWIEKQKKFAMDLQEKFNSHEWQQHQEEMAKKYQELAMNLQEKFNSPEWKKQQEEMVENAEKLSKDMAKNFNSEKWAQQQDEMAKHYQDLAMKLQKKFNSPEWKKQQEEMTRDAEKLSRDLMKKFNSDEWKKNQKLLMERLYSGNFKMDSLLGSLKSEKFRKLYRLDGDLGSLNGQLFEPGTFDFPSHTDNELRNSQQYKKLREKFQKNVERLKKKQARKARKEKDTN